MRMETHRIVIVSLVNKDMTIANINQLIAAIKANKIYLTMMSAEFDLLSPPVFLLYIP